MRPALRRTLEEYQEVARDEARQNLTDNEKNDLHAVREWYFRHHESRAGVAIEIQRRVYELQKKKNAIMAGLRVDFQLIEEGQGMTHERQETIPVRYDGEVLLADWNGESTAMTMGQMVADLTWNQRYHLDPASVPARLQKRYALERARAHLWDVMEEQIVFYEEANPNTPKEYKSAFHGILMNERAEGAHAEQAGLLAEKMVFSFLKRWQLDTATAFKVQRGDVYQDAFQKIDFLISVPSWLRGVQVEAESVSEPSSPLPNRLVQGFQLTAATDPSLLKKKQKAISEVNQDAERKEHMNDIALFRLNAKIVTDAYRAWVVQGKRPGGPAEYLTVDDAKRLICQVMDRLLPEEEVFRLCEAIDASKAEHLPLTKQQIRAYHDERTRLVKNPEQKRLDKTLAMEQKVERLSSESDKQEKFKQLQNLFTQTSRRMDELMKRLKMPITSLAEARDVERDVQGEVEILERFLETRADWEALAQGERLAKHFDVRWEEIVEKKKSFERRLPFVRLLKPYLEKADHLSPQEKLDIIARLGEKRFLSMQRLSARLERGDIKGMKGELSRLSPSLIKQFRSYTDRILTFLGSEPEKVEGCLKELISYLVAYRELEAMQKRVTQITQARARSDEYLIAA